VIQIVWEIPEELMKGVSYAQFPFKIRLEGKVVNREAFQSEYTEYIRCCEQSSNGRTLVNFFLLKYVRV